MQLGVVMVGSQHNTEWHMTEFVLAVDLDEHMAAESLWMFRNPEPPNPKMCVEGPFPSPSQYSMFNLYDISGLEQNHAAYPQALKLQCVDGVGWRRNSEILERGGDAGLPLSSFTWAAHQEPLHFARLAKKQLQPQPVIEYATKVLNNPPAAQSMLCRFPGPYWICSLPDCRHEAGCPCIPTGEGPLLREWQQWQDRQQSHREQVEQVQHSFRRLLKLSDQMTQQTLELEQLLQGLQGPP